MTTTPWLRIEDDYRTYLAACGYSAAEFNDPSFHRADAFNAFQQQQQQQQQQQPQPSITDLLEQAKGGPLTDSEMNCALMDYPQFIEHILSKTDPRERLRWADRLWIRICVRVKTQTRLAVREQYLLDAPVPGTFLNDGTEVQFAVRGSSLFCAKIMRDNGNLQREYDMATRIHGTQTCPTVMPVLDWIHLPGEQPRRVAMITPYYPISLSRFATGNLQEEGCVNVALCGLATIKAFHRQGVCHGDIKPGNMMLTAKRDNIVVTIDFGSCVEYGESLVSLTPGFGMECPQKGSLKYDLTCLASSLYVIGTGETLPETTWQLVQSLERGDQTTLPPSLQIALRCLQIPDIDSIWEYAKECVQATDAMDRSLIVSYDTVWPKVK